MLKINTATGAAKRLSALYFGLSGSGATTAAINDARTAGRNPLVVVLGAPDGVEAIEGINYIQITTAEDWGSLVDGIGGILAEHKHDALVIDGVGQLLAILVRDMGGAKDARQTYGAVTTALNGHINALKAATDYLVLTTHTVTKEVTVKDPVTDKDVVKQTEEFDVNPALLNTLLANLGQKIYTYALVKANDVFYGVERNATLALKFKKVGPPAK